MRLKIEHPVSLDKEAQDRLVANFKKAMLDIDGNGRKDDAAFRSALAEWSQLELAVEKQMG